MLCYFLLALTIGIIERTWFDSRIVTTIFLWSYASHLILDMLTIQGVPLLYPFRKNLCVIPGNPKFRLRSSELKTESLAFVLFIMLSFSCKDLLANGFWNTYDKIMATVKSVHHESRLTDGAILVRYDVNADGRQLQGMGYLVNSSTEKLVLFDSAKGFLNILSQDRIKNLKPIRSGRKREIKGFSFTAISTDSLERLTKDRIILSLKLQAELPLYYTKDYQPQSGTSVALGNVYNPLFRSADVDSIDVSTEKEISLIKLQLQEEAQKQAYYVQQKGKALEAFSAVQAALGSDDMAERERAIKEQERARAAYENLSPPLDNRPALQLRLGYLQNRLHIRKRQAINGYISYLLIE